MTNRILILFIIILFFSLATSACVSAPPTQEMAQIDLTDLQPIPDPQQSEIIPFQIAIAAVISPMGTAENYGLLIAYLENELDRPFNMVQRRTYAEVNDLIETGDVGLAFVCTSAYIAGREDFDMQLLVAPVVNGGTFYHSQLIVPIDSTAKSIADLEGKVFAFTDPMSFTGRVYPTYLLQQLGKNPSTFFQNTFFTYSHDDAIRAVAEGLADGAAVDSLVLDFALAREPELGTKIKIIHNSPPFGIPPVVVNPDIRPQLRSELETILLNMHKDPEGLKALQASGIEQFTMVTPALYDLVEEIITIVENNAGLP